MDWADVSGRAVSPARCALAFVLQTLLPSFSCKPALAVSGLAAAWNQPLPSDLVGLFQSWTCWPMCLLIIDITLHYLGLFQQTDTLLPDRHLPDRLIDNILKKVSSCICTVKDCNFITLPPTPASHWQISATLPWNLNRNLSMIMIFLDNGLNLYLVGAVVLMLVSLPKIQRKSS